MKSSAKKRIIKFVITFVLVALMATISAVALSACGEIRYDYYVLTTADNGDGTLTVTACTVVKDKPVVIPAEYKGKKVVALGDGSKTVFSGCEFTTLILEAGVKTINDNACKDWSTLTTLELNEGLERIGANAFSGCTALKDIVVPKSVTGIGEGAFENTAWYKDQPNGKIIYVGSFLYEYKGNMAPNTVLTAEDIKADTKYISDYAFSDCSGLKNIILPIGLEKIGASAFKGCTSLESIDIPASVNSVGEKAFAGCTLLSTVHIPAGIGSIAPSMFYDCCGLNNVDVGDGIKAVGASAFENCVGLMEITLPGSVESIGDGAFQNCVKLQTVNNAQNVEALGDNAFNNCIALEDCVLSDKTKSVGAGAFDNCVKIEKVELPEAAQSVGAGAFNNCINVEKITIKRNADKKVSLSFGSEAFSNCFKLSGVYIDDLAAWCGYAFEDAGANPLAQAGKLFVNNVKAQELSVPNGVKEIGAYAFVNGEFDKVVLPESPEGIGASAFKGCLHLKNGGVEIKNVDKWCGIRFDDPESNPLYYGEKLFVNGQEANEIAVTEGVEKVGAYAFYNCVSLKKIALPKTVSYVGADAFSGCAFLGEINVALGEQPEEWDGEWNDFCGTETKGGTKIHWTGEKKIKLTTNTIMAIVVGSILVVVVIVLLIMWLIRKIKRKIRGPQRTEEAKKEVAATEAPALESEEEEPAPETEKKTSPAKKKAKKDE